MSVKTRILHASRRTVDADMYLVDTDAISEARKREKSNAGVRAFFKRAKEEATELYLSAVTIGELRQGVLCTRKLSSAVAQSVDDQRKGRR